MTFCDKNCRDANKDARVRCAMQELLDDKNTENS